MLDFVVSLLHIFNINSTLSYNFNKQKSPSITQYLTSNYLNTLYMFKLLDHKMDTNQ